MKELANKFTRFAIRECRGISPLYETLALQIAKDDELLTLCAAGAGRGQPIPNLLFGAVHYLMLKGMKHPLVQYYVSIHREVKDSAEAFSHFKDFCLLYREDIVHLLETKLVQTNEVRRCGYLYPVFSYLYECVKKPLALVEIGTSAGLQLLWDQYVYHYGADNIYGHRESDVQIHSICRKGQPFLTHEITPVSKRIGVDLKVVNLTDEESFLWLNALIWPEHEARRTLFKQAAKVVQRHDLDLREGDGITMLPEIADELPEDSIICIFHTHVANQFSEDMKHTLEHTIRTMATTRDVAHIYNNMWDQKLHLDYCSNGSWHHHIVGETDGHGSWFTWEV